MNDIVEVTADEYHADPCDEPSLSKSIAHLLCTSSPAHARAAHPKLNPAMRRDDSAKFDVGTVCHALLLQEETLVHVVYASDWKKKVAQDEREIARAAGKIPLLAHQWDDVKAMLATTRPQLDQVDVTPGLFVDGKPERMLTWQERGVTCRALLDWLHDDLSAIDDYKTTSRSAAPEAWSRAMFSQGADMQVAFYLRGLRAVTGVADAAFRFVVQETFAPYALSVFEISPDVLAVAEAKIDFAIDQWRRCLDRDEWPAYPTRVCSVVLPPWEEQRWLEREERAGA